MSDRMHPATPVQDATLGFGNGLFAAPTPGHTVTVFRDAEGEGGRATPLLTLDRATLDALRALAGLDVEWKL